VDHIGPSGRADDVLGTRRAVDHAPRWFGKPLSDEFGKLPHPEDKDGFDRDVPG
jgi:hypothetical protein